MEQMLYIAASSLDAAWQNGRAPNPIGRRHGAARPQAAAPPGGIPRYPGSKAWPADT